MRKICTDLIELLDSERKVLLSGAFEKLEGISDKKQILREELSENLEQLTEAELTKLKRLSQQNDRLLKASLDGLGAVKDRLSKISEVQNQLTTYGGDGKISHAKTNQNSIERRA